MDTRIANAQRAAPDARVALVTGGTDGWHWPGCSAATRPWR